MPGLEDTGSRQLSTLGVPLAPTDVQPIVSTGAVQQMVDSVRAGDITAKDILNRKANMAQRAAAVEQGQEFIDPAAIEARKSAVSLAGATAQREQASLGTKALIDKHFQYRTRIYDAAGKEDLDAEAESGHQLSQAESQFAFAQSGLQATPQQFIENGQQKVRLINALGDNITPNPDGTPNPLVAYYQGIRNDAFMALHSPPKVSKSRPGTFATPPDPENGDETPAPFITPDHVKSNAIHTSSALSPADVQPAPLPPPVVDPANPSQARAWLFDSKVMLPNAARDLSDPEAVAAYNSYQAHLTPAPAPAAPATTIDTGTSKITVEPAQPAVNTKPVVFPASPMGNSMATANLPGFYKTPEEITKFRSDELYKNWAEKSGTIGRFRATTKAYTGKPGEITTQNDMDLASAALQMVMPSTGGGGRGMAEYKPRSLEETQPLLEQLYGIKAKLLKEHVFEKGTRDRIIAAGERTARNLEAPARGVVQTAMKQLADIGQPPETFIYPHEQSLLSQTPMAAPETALGQPVVIGGRKLQPLGNGKYRVIE